MIHFLWLGTAAALCGSAIHRASRRSAPTLRYAISLATLTVLAALPIVIAAWLGTSNTSSIVLADGADESISRVATSPPTPAPRLRSAVADAPQTAPPPILATRDSQLKAPFLEQVAIHLPWLWLIGAPLTFALLATGLVGAERLRRRSQLVESASVQKMCELLCRSLRTGRKVSIAVCDSLAQPILVGIVRPLILLPPAALTGWTPQQLEMVLVHELAHVRRWDNLVNLLQRIVESLLFFHPAVWIVSRQVRRDREECCDAVVVAHTAKPQAYAQLLVALAAPPAPLAGLAMARHPLSGRIRRILKLEDEPMLVSRKTLGLAGVALAALLAVALWQPGEESNAQEPIAISESSDVDREDMGTPFSVDLEFLRPKKVFPDPRAGEIWIETQKALLKSDLVLKNAIRQGNLHALSVLQSSGDPVASLNRNVHVHTTPHGFRISMGGNPQDKAELLQILQAIVKSYQTELGPRTYAVQQAPASRVVPDPGPRVFNPPPREAVLQPGDQVHLDVVGDFQDRPLTADYTVESTGTLALGATYGRVKVAGKSLLDAEAAVLKHLETIFDGPKVQLTFLARSQPIYQPAPVLPSVNPFSSRAGRSSSPTALTTPVPAPQLATVWIDPRSGVPAEALLLYDGKTFDAWRRMWKTELKTERRTECVKALVAFARAGHAKQAAETILDVAKEYDFSKIQYHESKSVRKLMETIREALNDRTGIPSKEWLPVLVERVNHDPARWNSLLEALLPGARSREEEISAIVKALASDPNNASTMRAAALQALIYQNWKVEDQRIVAMLRDVLTGEDEVMARKVVDTLGFRRFDRFPETLDLLFHGSPNMRGTVASRLGGGGEHAPEILTKLLSVLDDPQRSKDHPIVLLAIQTMGSSFSNNPDLRSRKQQVVAKLEKILLDGDRQLLPPTIAALSSLTSKSSRLIVEEVANEVSQPRHKQLLEAAEEAEHIRAPNYGGGGGGGGFF